MAIGANPSSALTAEQVQSVLIRPLEAESKFLSMGPTMFTSNGGQVRIPKLGAPTSPQWVGENTVIPEVDPGFDEVVLLPSTMKSIKTLTRFSNELARQSVVSLDAALQARLVTDVAGALDAQLFGSTGDGISTPRGLFAHAGSTDVELTGPLTLDAVLDGLAVALAENVDQTKLKLVVRSEDFIALRAEKDADNRYQLAYDPSLGGGFTVHGIPVVVTNRVPAGRAALLDASQIAVAQDMAPSVTILDQTFGDFDQQAIRVVARYDAAPMNAKAIVTFSGIVAA